VKTYPVPLAWFASLDSPCHVFAAASSMSIEAFDEDVGRPRTLALFPEDRCAAVTPDSSTEQLRLSAMRLCRPRHCGACWLAGQLWDCGNWIASGPSVCRSIAKARGGIRSCRGWCRTG
jgi:hypothetical protein